jgi:hypothetical protein
MMRGTLNSLGGDPINPPIGEAAALAALEDHGGTLTVAQDDRMLVERAEGFGGMRTKIHFDADESREMHDVSDSPEGFVWLVPDLIVKAIVESNKPPQNTP